MAQPGSTSMHFKELFWSPRPRRWIQWGSNWPTRLTIRSVDETWWCRGSEDIWTHPIWRSFWAVELCGVTAWQALAPRPLALTPRSRGLSRIPEQKHGKSMEKFGKGDLSEGNTVEHMWNTWASPEKSSKLGWGLKFEDIPSLKSCPRWTENPPPLAATPLRLLRRCSWSWNGGPPTSATFSHPDVFFCGLTMSVSYMFFSRHWDISFSQLFHIVWLCSSWFHMLQFLENRLFPIWCDLLQPTRHIFNCSCPSVKSKWHSLKGRAEGTAVGAADAEGVPTVRLIGKWYLEAMTMTGNKPRAAYRRLVILFLSFFVVCSWFYCVSGTVFTATPWKEQWSTRTTRVSLFDFVIVIVCASTLRMLWTSPI